MTRDGVRVHVTPTQYRILEQLAVAGGSLVTKDRLVESCLDADGGVGGSSLHSHITRLRRLFDGCLVFESTWGAGYALRIAEVGSGTQPT